MSGICSMFVQENLLSDVVLVTSCTETKLQTILISILMNFSCVLPGAFLRAYLIDQFYLCKLWDDKILNLKPFLWTSLIHYKLLQRYHKRGDLHSFDVFQRFHKILLDRYKISKVFHKQAWKTSFSFSA